MAQTRQVGTRPAPNRDANTSPARLDLKIQDGALSVTVFEKSKGDSVHQFIVPERAYRQDEEWVHTHMLHVEDLLPMAQLMIRLYGELRQKFPSQSGADSE